MAKLTNPLFSLSAHGSLNKTISFLSNGKNHSAKFFGKYSAKRKTAPSQEQTFVRTDFSRASIFTKYLDNTEKTALLSRFVNTEQTDRNNIMQAFIKEKPTELGLLSLGNNNVGSL
jgi:hypothetical protein